MIKNLKDIALFWFRRDLRLKDNRALFEALQNNKQVLPLFVFDDHIVGELPREDHRISFIYDALESIHHQLKTRGKGLLVRRGKPQQVFESLLNDYHITHVYSNRDHEPYGVNRDENMEKWFGKKGIIFRQYLDHLIFDKDEVLTAEGNPYQVYTPYANTGIPKVTPRKLSPWPSEDHLQGIYYPKGERFPSLLHMGFIPSDLKSLPLQIGEDNIRRYHLNRDHPARNGTSHLGVHLRFGTLSIREMAKKAIQWNAVFLRELLWREFYAMILWHHPHVVHQSFKPAYDVIQWRNDAREFQKWQEGKTGYPMVDAGMRQLNATGYMHNRLRMVTASFLAKHLLIDWRLGEAYFGEKLFDYELSSNNGGWQWSAGTGADAAPYFRIFNPASQQKKFDPRGDFISTWIPELNTKDYPSPIVDHKIARERCLQVFKKALEAGR